MNQDFIYFFDTNTKKVYGYLSVEEAEEFHDDFIALIRLKVQEAERYRFNKPKGGVWDIEKMEWVVDEKLLKEETIQEKKFEIEEKHEKIITLSQEIQEHLLMEEKEEAKNKVLEKRQLEKEVKELEEEIKKLESE